MHFDASSGIKQLNIAVLLTQAVIVEVQLQHFVRVDLPPVPLFPAPRFHGVNSIPLVQFSQKMHDDFLPHYFLRIIALKNH